MSCLRPPEQGESPLALGACRRVSEVVNKAPYVLIHNLSNWRR